MLKKSKVALAIVLASASCFAFGQQANSNIEVITVTANKKEENLQQVLASVTVIDRAEIERSNARDLASLLANQTGLQVNRQGAQGQTTSLFIRGLETKYTLILIDGVRVGSATLGYKSIANIPLSSIERVEIVKGSRAAYYGSDALAGVINIITRQDVSDKVALTLGSNNYHNVQLSNAHNTQNLKLSLNAGYEKTNGIDVLENDKTNAADPDNDGYYNANLGANVRYQLSDNVAFKALAQYSKGYVEFDNYYDGQATSLDKTDFENYHAVIGATLTGEKLSNSIDLAYTQDQDKTAASYGDSKFQTSRIQLDYVADYIVNDTFSLNGGVNWYQDKLDTSTAYSVTSRDNIAAFVGAYYELNALTVNGALRLDDNEQFGSKETYSWAVGYQVNEEVLVRYTQSSGFKAPTFNDLYYPNSGNPNLLAETSLNREVGVRYFADAYSVEATAYKNEFANKIAWAPSPTPEQPYRWAPANIGNVASEGVEVEATTELFGFEHGVSFSYTSTEDLKTQQALNFVSPRIWRYQLGKVWGEFDMNFDIQYHSAAKATLVAELPAYTIANVSGNYQFSEQLSINARIENLFDKEYHPSQGYGVDLNGDYKNDEVYFYNAQGITGFVGVSYLF